MNTHSIRFRLAAWHAALFTAVIMVLGAVLYATVKEYLDDTLLETQGRRAHQIAETLLANAPRTGEDYVVREIKALYSPEQSDRFIRVTRGDGSVLYVSGPPDDQSFDPSRVSSFTPRDAVESARSEKLS